LPRDRLPFEGKRRGHSGVLGPVASRGVGGGVDAGEGQLDGADLAPAAGGNGEIDSSKSVTEAIDNP
jgi:hypothetical protein